MNLSFLYINFTWPAWWILCLLGLALALQIFGLVKQLNLSKKQKIVKFVLNMMVWAMILLFVLKPSFTETDTSSGVLIAGKDLPSAVVARLKDSLHLSKTLSYADFSAKTADDPEFSGRLGHLYLAGQDATPDMLARLSARPVSWLPYFKTGDLQDLTWPAVVRRGDVLRLSGKIEAEEAETLKVTFGGAVLDSTQLHPGFNAFELKFPAFTSGRTQASLELDGKKLQDIHFFVVNKPALSVLFILENPDFESKTLAEWLGQQGHQVEISTKVAKNTLNKAILNKTGKAFIPDLIVTNPANAGNAQVKKALNEGRNVLFFNLSQPEQELKVINQALGTHWQAKKISNEESIPAGKDLSALPYQFGAAVNQEILEGYPVAVRKINGKTAVTLLNETFPLKLSGDSLAYGQLWSGILQALEPVFKDNVSLNAPVVKDVRTAITLNNLSLPTESLRVAGDTVGLNPSPVNPQTQHTSFIFRKEGWQPLADSIEVFVAHEQTSLTTSKQISDALGSRSAYGQKANPKASQTLTTEIPDWLWFLLIVLGFTALWVESKFRY